MSPLRRARQELGLTLTGFARLAGVAPAYVSAAETGLIRRPERLLAALASLGYDPDALLAEYEAWRTQQQAAARERLARARVS